MRILVLLGLLTCVACLKCPSCIYATISNVPETVKVLVDSALSAFGNEKCNDVLTGPVDEIKEETCPEEHGKVSRCVLYKGVLIMKIPQIGEELPFHVSKRRCYSAAAAATPGDGCHDHSADKTIKDLSALQEVIDAFSSFLVVHSFHGQRCLYNETYRRSSSSLFNGYHTRSSTGLYYGTYRRPITDHYYIYETYDWPSSGLSNKTYSRPSPGLNNEILSRPSYGLHNETFSRPSTGATAKASGVFMNGSLLLILSLNLI